MNNFTYNIPVKVYFGRDQLNYLGEELRKYGRRVLLAYGGGSMKRTGLYDRVISILQSNGLDYWELGGIEPNPKIDSVRQGAEICKQNKIDVLLSVGGGSTLDCTKWIAAGACADHDPWLFFSENYKVKKALPIIDIMTMAATGSEMDPGGVITNPETHEKLGRRGEPLFPKVSFLDPTLTYSVSAYQTACGAVDIMSHILESYFDQEQELFMLDYFMEGMMKTVIRYAPIAMKHPDDYEARANLMWTASWAINGFAKGGRTQAWSCHPMQHEMGAINDMTHGLGLAILLPRWLEYCLSEKTVSRYCRFAINVFDVSPNLEQMEIAKLGVHKLAEFFYKELGLADTLNKVGIPEDVIDQMAEKACGGGTLNGFVPLQKEDIKRIYRMCL